jgi:radical SAM superfamily enzyme YgiQ (UPF0313 family)
MFPKKNVLLINPWIYDFTAYDFWAKPLGLLYLASLLRRHTGFSTYFIDCLDRYHPLLDKRTGSKADGRGPFPKEEVTKPRILDGIPRKYSRYGIPVHLFERELDRVPRPDLVLLTCAMTYWYPGVQMVVELVRKKFGSVPLILGGIYPTLVPQHALSQTGVDFICRGPGEREIFDLINSALGDGTCPSLSFESLDELPLPAFDLLRDRSSLPLLTSRGCLSSCSFCACSLLYPRLEQRSVFSVLRELDIICKLYRPVNISFYDDALLLNKSKHILPLLKGIIDKNFPFKFHTPNGLHVGEIDRDLAFLLKQAGFLSLYLSQETFDEDLIQQSCPKVSTDGLGKTLDHLEKAGFERAKINVYLIVGLPGQSPSAVEESVRRVLRLGARPRLAYFSPIPGTADWERLISAGRMEGDADPLLHNKLVFSYLWGDISQEDLKYFKSLGYP